ncbi:L-rhamnose mutarotase [Mariniflexile ostreae]|uniref:L-rhamnose mutarotase n=1 Tax=Mariniflexile ostreae TaxID=1520892 RepID=A0ABV5FA95_9FLAO
MKNLKRYGLTLDLVNDQDSIAEYKKYHEQIWPEITKSLFDAGIENAEIYCVGNRLFMILEVNDSFSFEKKSDMDAKNPKVQEWEALMWKYQQALPIAKEGEKWVLMDRIYQLNPQ